MNTVDNARVTRSAGFVFRQLFAGSTRRRGPCSSNSSCPLSGSSFLDSARARPIRVARVLQLESLPSHPDPVVLVTRQRVSAAVLCPPPPFDRTCLLPTRDLGVIPVCPRRHTDAITAPEGRCTPQHTYGNDRSPPRVSLSDPSRRSETRLAARDSVSDAR